MSERLSEETSEIKRANIWFEIHRIVSKLKLKETNGDSYDYNSVSTELLNLFELRAVSSWVSVKFEPEKNDYYLVCAKSFEDDPWVLAVCYFSKEHKWTDSDVGIKFWQKLPSPPQ